MAADLTAIQAQISALNLSDKQDLSGILTTDARYELRRDLRALDRALLTEGQLVEELVYTVRCRPTYIEQL